MWVVEFGEEWADSWASVVEQLARPDAALGAITFAMRHDPLRYSTGLTSGRDSLRIFRTRDWVDGKELWVYVHVLETPPRVTLKWAQLAEPRAYPL